MRLKGALPVVTILAILGASWPGPCSAQGLPRLVVFIPGYQNDWKVFLRDPPGVGLGAVAESIYALAGGDGVFFPNLLDSIGGIPQNAHNIRQQIDSVLVYTGRPPDAEVDLVGYSTGGAIARHIAILEQPRPKFRIRRIVAIGSPLRGISTCVRNGGFVRQWGNASHQALYDLWAHGAYMKHAQSLRLPRPTFLKSISGAPHFSPFPCPFAIPTNDPEFGAWDGIVARKQSVFPGSPAENYIVAIPGTAHASRLGNPWLLTSSDVAHEAADFLFRFASTGGTAPSIDTGADESAALLLKPSPPPFGLFQDAFPFNESFAPGPGPFDTTTALMVSSMNINARRHGGDGFGVIQGDSTLVDVPWLDGVRVDLVFRILPGPGCYNVKGNRLSGLRERDPAHPFWSSYLADNGEFGTPGGHGGTWNPHVWNSVRLDSAEVNLHPIQSRDLGGPRPDLWMGTLHEQDPRFGTLGIFHARCFLDDPAGPADASNTRCDGNVPFGYGIVPGSTREGTKVLPDGYFTPGTHIEYFFRASSPTLGVQYTPDTTTVLPQTWASGENRDGERWFHVDVLPDLWKDVRFGGSGLACVLLVDAQDPEGSQLAWHGALDTLGYGKGNGAACGWRASTPAITDANDPAGFVAANLGQYGARFDQYDIGAASSYEGGRLGGRFSAMENSLRPWEAKVGPSLAMLEAFYSTIIYTSGRLRGSTLGPMAETPNFGDAELLNQFLQQSGPGNLKVVWLTGESLLEAQYSYPENGSPMLDLEDLVIRAGVEYVGPDVKESVFCPNLGWSFRPQLSGLGAGQQYTLVDGPDYSHDAIAPAPVEGSVAAAQAYCWETGGAGAVLSVRRSSAPDGSRTQFDSFDLASLREDTRPGGGGYPTMGRIRWVRDVLNSFGTCPPASLVVSVDPSMASARESPALRVLPNPTVDGKVRLLFRSVRHGRLRARWFTPSGRLLRDADVQVHPGENAVQWDGTDGRGIEQPPGLVFLRLEDPATHEVLGRAKVVRLRP
jgi:hypothetical protein